MIGASARIRQVLRVCGLHIAVVCIRGLYRVFLLFPQRRRIVFLSRQSSSPLDFRLIEPQLRERLPEFEITWACAKEKGRIRFALLLRQLLLVATSSLCIMDGYEPAVSVCAGLHRAKCMQIWHALGAIKQFGWQSVGTPAGRPPDIAKIFRMHEGYDCVVAGCAGTMRSYAEAFKCDMRVVANLGLPRIDYLGERKELASSQAFLDEAPAVIGTLAQARCEGRTVVLYAPTFRKGSSRGSDWLDREVQALRHALPDPEALLVVARHPFHGSDLHSREHALVYLREVSAIDALCVVDCVVTDYSAVAFEAWISGVEVLFYTPDIEEYRVSPGLNVDPERQFPNDTFLDAEGVAERIRSLLNENEVAARLGAETRGDSPEAEDSFHAFMREYAGGVPRECGARLVEHAAGLMRGGCAQ